MADQSAVRDQTGKVVSQVGRHVGRLLTERKDRAADGLHRVADVLRAKARDLGQHNGGGGQIAHYTNRAALRMDSMATYMRGTDLSTMLRDAGRFARRPEVVVVGTIVTGLLVARVLKARREAAKPWWSARGRWDHALPKGTQATSAAMLQKGAHVMSSAADTLADALRRGAGARDLSSLSSKTSSGSGLGKYLAIVGDRLVDRVAGENMKATTLLKRDHAAVKKLLADFGRTTARAAKRRQALIDEIAQELDIHSTIEEEIFYPACDGKVEEDTFDYYAQDRQGNVWYFGESTAEYVNSYIVSIDGTFIAGQGGAKPGIIMAAHPAPGMTVRQEFALDEAEDLARYESVGGTLVTRMGTFRNVLKTFELTPLEPEARENKYYAPGIGNVLTVDLATGEQEALVSFER